MSVTQTAPKLGQSYQRDFVSSTLNFSEKSVLPIANGAISSFCTLNAWNKRFMKNKAESTNRVPRMLKMHSITCSKQQDHPTNQREMVWVFTTHKHAALFLCSGLRNCVLMAKALLTDPLQAHPLCSRAHLSDGRMGLAADHLDTRTVNISNTLCPPFPWQSLNTLSGQTTDSQKHVPCHCAEGREEMFPSKVTWESVLGRRWLLSKLLLKQHLH